MSMLTVWMLDVLYSVNVYCAAMQNQLKESAITLTSAIAAALMQPPTAQAITTAFSIPCPVKSLCDVMIWSHR